MDDDADFSPACGAELIANARAHHEHSQLDRESGRATRTACVRGCREPGRRLRGSLPRMSHLTAAALRHAHEALWSFWDMLFSLGCEVQHNVPRNRVTSQAISGSTISKTELTLPSCCAIKGVGYTDRA